MYNPKDIQFNGKHDYDKESAMEMSRTGWNKTFSVGIFKWVLKSDGKSLKKGNAIVRISGPCEKREEVFKMAENVVLDLDSNNYDGTKTITIK